MRLLALVIFASLAARCSGNCVCSNFVFPNDRNEDVGDCEVASVTPYGPNNPLCYLQGWSVCFDEVQSIALPGMWVSRAACPSVGPFGPFRFGQSHLTEESFEDEIDKRLRQARAFFEDGSFGDEIDKRLQQARAFFDNESDLLTIPALLLPEDRLQQVRVVEDESDLQTVRAFPIPEDRLQQARRVFDDGFEEEEEFKEEERMKQAF